MRKSCTQLDFVCLGGQYYGLGQSNLHRLDDLEMHTHEWKKKDAWFMGNDRRWKDFALNWHKAS